MRVMRGETVVFDGNLSSLKHHKVFFYFFLFLDNYFSWFIIILLKKCLSLYQKEKRKKEKRKVRITLVKYIEFLNLWRSVEILSRKGLMRADVKDEKRNMQEGGLRRT